MTKRICLLGGESSGKTTLAFELGRQLGVPVVEEYGRQLWLERAGQLAFEELLQIAERHVELEESACRQSKSWVVVDTSPLTTLFYCLDQFGTASPSLRELAGRRYDATLLCAPDFPFVQDGARRDETFRQTQYEWYVEQLEQRSVPYLLVSGPLERRTAQALAYVGGLPPRQEAG